MSQSDRAIKKLATDLARLKREVVSWRGAQADYTSIENGGNFTFKDGDGNVTAIVGGQDDGSNTIRHVDGPVPPIPSGLSAHVDGPIVQVSWDGSFEDADTATYDWSHLEVVAVGPSNEQLTATINDVTGATANLAATASGEWTVVARSVSRAEKRSLDGDAGTVDVELVGLTGAINDAIGSANGKNTVTYAEVPPTPADEGIVGDTWWVGQVGRPNDIVEATNLVLNPSADPTGSPWGNTGGGGESVAMSYRTRGGLNTARATLTSTSGYTYLMPGQSVSAIDKLTPVTPGETISASMLVACSVDGNRNLRFGFRNSSGAFQSWSADGPSTDLPADGDLVELKIENVTVPSGAAYAYVHTRGPLEGQGNWVEGTHAQVVKSSTVGEYFSGDTEDGETDNEPHYRWTGTPHASTSEKYLPAIPDSGSDAWNITEQWQYTSSGWKPVEVSHEVIATVDLGKATVGELDGIRIMAKTISGDLFTGDAFDGIVFRGNTFTTRDGNGEFSDRGLFFQKPDGTSIFRVPTDGTPISMSASDVQIERAQVDELDLNIGRVRSGGLFELSSGVTPPAAPPELNAAWARATTLAQPESDHNYDWTGLARWGDKWVRGVNVLGAVGDDLDRIEIYNPDGTLDRSFKIENNPRSGVTVLGDTVYTLGPSHTQTYYANYLHGYDLNTGNRVMSSGFTRFYAKNQKKIAIGNDGENLLVAGVAPEAVLYVLRLDRNSGAQIGSDMTTPFDAGYAANIHGVEIHGGKLYVSATAQVREYVETGGSWSLDGFAWDNPNRDGAGFVFVDGKPFVVNGPGVVFEGSTRSSDYTAEVCYTLYDGTHETTPSPVASINVAARETATITLPYREGLGKRVYYRAAGGTNWARENVAENVTATPLPTGVAYFQPPASNSFPNADPAVFRSTNGNVVVRGDGSGSWGPLTFNPDGSMSGIRKTSSGTLTVSAPSDGGTTSTWVMFPEGRFTTAPTVTTSLRSTAPNSSSVSTGGATATGFYIYFYRVNDNPTGVNWIAAEEG